MKRRSSNEAGFDKSADSRLLTKLSDHRVWRHELVMSGFTIDEVPALTSLANLDIERRGKALTDYNKERRLVIMDKLSNGQVGRSCRKYGILVEGRPCPSFF